MANFRDLLNQLRREVEEVGAEEVHDRLEAGDRLSILDVREAEEAASGMIPGAQQLSRAHFESRVEDVLPDKDAPVVVYCATGVRSVFASRTLEELGYARVASMAGGFARWKDLGYPFETLSTLDVSQRQRYARHLILSDVGEQGQLKLLDSKVLVVGAGGLGSPALLYLAAAGVGTIGVVDEDVVDETNLQRQIIHDTEKVGTSKAVSAKQVIEKLNPDVTVVLHETRLEPSNAAEIMSGYDVVVDGTDNFDARYAINDASIGLDIPVVHGSIFRFEGMVSTFVPNDGPCYRCLYPEAPPAELAPSCSEAGVLGVLPGIVGTLQANEALKLLVGYGEPLKGRLLVFDAQTTRFDEVRIRRDPDCPACGERAASAEPAQPRRIAAVS